MTTTAADTEQLRELDEDLRRAWGAYYGSLQELTGAEYERVEPESWEALQSELGRIARCRSLLSVAND